MTPPPPPPKKCQSSLDLLKKNVSEMFPSREDGHVRSCVSPWCMEQGGWSRPPSATGQGLQPTDTRKIKWTFEGTRKDFLIACLKIARLTKKGGSSHISHPKCCSILVDGMLGSPKMSLAPPFGLPTGLKQLINPGTPLQYCVKMVYRHGARLLVVRKRSGFIPRRNRHWRWSAGQSTSGVWKSRIKQRNETGER